MGEAPIKKSAPALFLDRDGVICKSLPRGQYLLAWGQFELMEGIIDLVLGAKRRGYLTVVLTNQASIAKKLISVEELEDIHRRMAGLFHGALDRVYYCPHQASDGCSCRKPNPGMLLTAQRDLHIDLANSLFVGDSDKDVGAGSAAGCRTVFLKNEYNKSELLKCTPHFVISSLREAIPLLK